MGACGISDNLPSFYNLPAIDNQYIIVKICNSNNLHQLRTPLSHRHPFSCCRMLYHLQIQKKLPRKRTIKPEITVQKLSCNPIRLDGEVDQDDRNSTTGSTNRLCLPVIHLITQLLPCFEFDHCFSWNLNFFTSLRIPAGPGRPFIC